MAQDNIKLSERIRRMLFRLTIQRAKSVNHRKQLSNLSAALFRVAWTLSLFLMAVACFTEFATAQGGTLTNGGNHSGSITVPSRIDTWTFVADKDDDITLSLGEVIVGQTDPGFVPLIRLLGPTGAQLAVDQGNLAARIIIKAPLTGTYTVQVFDSTVNRAGTALGSYLLHFVKVPGNAVIPAGDEGGPLTNGGKHPGKIHRGDLDVWTFSADKNDSLIVSIGEVLETQIDPGFVPRIRLFGPTGAELGADQGNLAARIGPIVAPLTGTYTVIVADSAVNREGSATGSYLLYFVKAPGT